MSDDSTDERHWEAVEEAAELIVQGQFPAALEQLRDIVKADPLNPYAYHHIGVALSHLEQLEAARDAYRAAVRLRPNFLGALVGLSDALRLLGHHAGALTQAKEALRRFPDSVEAQSAVRMAAPAEGDEEGLEAMLDDPPEAPAEPDWAALRALTRKPAND
jgi:tetratricopeptide (TPR) repeat protein